MKFINKVICLLLVVSVTACYEEAGNEIVFNAPSQLEWEESDSGSQAVYEKANDGESVVDGLVVNLVGPKPTAPVTFTIEVDELTTAIEGVHYTLPEGFTYTIPAGSNSIEVPIEYLDDNVDADTELNSNFQLVLNIVSGSLKLNPNYSKLVHTFKFVCPSEIPLGTYNVITNATSTDGCPSPNPIVNFASTVEITSPGIAQYRLSDFFAGVYIEMYGDCYGYTFATPAVFNDSCGDLSFSFVEGFGATVTGSGLYNKDTGVITIDWVNDFGDTGSMTLTPQ